MATIKATGLVATVAHPLRERLQRGINQLMYGERDDPYTVLANLGQRLEATLIPGSVFSILVETVSQSLRLPYAAIALNQDDSFTIAASCGSSQEIMTRLPILYQRETIGQLIVASRSPGEAFSRADLRLLESLAQQAGIAAYTVRLNADLQRSRERLVTTREEERRRLRRDLHDGLGPTLAGIMLRVDATRNLLVRDSAAADKILAEMGTQVETVIADIRRLVYELRPPTLDELGLLAALGQHAKQMTQTSGIQITIDGPDPLPSLPAALEVAFYRIGLEALTNVIRHSGASQCEVRLVVMEGICLEIRDNGRGLSSPSLLLPERRIGVGLHSMRERAAELGGTCEIESSPGGGTLVKARLPLPAIETA